MPPTRPNRAQQQITADLLAITSKLVRRAESNNVRTQHQTFAVHPQTGSQLLGMDDQVVFGRRGSGKTHLFGWAAYQLQQQGHFALVVDYPEPPMVILSGADPSKDQPFSTSSLYSLIRPLIVDVAEYARALATDRRTSIKIRDRAGFDAAITRLLKCADAIQFQYEATRTDTISRNAHASADAGLGAELAESLIRPTAHAQVSTGARIQGHSMTTRQGSEVRVLDSAEIARAFADVVIAIGGRFYLFIDEWSRVPIEHQPIVAEFIKRTFCAVPECAVKIGAIQERSRFDAVEHGQRVGLELSSDAFADVNLDGMHPSRNFEAVRDFLLDLLHKHYRQMYREHFKRAFPLKQPHELVGTLFNSEDTFSEFVEACAGVPRDGLNIIMKATPFCMNAPISKRALRAGVLEWFRTDKQNFYKPGTVETLFYDWLKQTVLRRRSKGFLIDDGSGDPLVENLRENRVLHLVNSSVSSKGHPGKRFKYYRLDYGCYVDLQDTSARPEHELGEAISVNEFGTVQYDTVEADRDDERAAFDRARSVILDVSEFYAAYELGQGEVLVGQSVN